jgi:peptidoglycan hydrolase-like protein with peptidoglycan-binding domain
MLRRAPLTPEERAQDLANEPYAGNERLQQAYDNAPPLRLGERLDAVALVQQGLIDDGILLPNSTASGTAPPDGIFGVETNRAVQEFQAKHGLDVDGEVGRQTMGRLDQLAAGRTSVPPGTEGPGDIYEGLPEIAAGMPVDALLAALDAAPPEMLEQLARNAGLLTSLSETLSPGDLGQVAARLCLRVPANVVNPVESRQEAQRIMASMLGGNEDIATRAIQRVRAVIVPANRLLTEVSPFTRLAGERASLDRPAEMARGVTISEGSLSYSALPEENLLGIRCTAVYIATTGKKAGIPQTPVSQGEGTSIAVHELGHGIANTALTDADMATINEAYGTRTRRSDANPNDPDQWVDGRKGCYASLTVAEFFTQLSAAYLGTNHGYDRTTFDRRHNGKEWVQTHEPAVFAILERTYAGASIAGTNPTHDPLAYQEPQPLPTIEEILFGHV